MGTADIVELSIVVVVADTVVVVDSVVVAVVVDIVVAADTPLVSIVVAVVVVVVVLFEERHTLEDAEGQEEQGKQVKVFEAKLEGWECNLRVLSG